jgi:integrase
MRESSLQMRARLLKVSNALQVARQGSGRIGRRRQVRTPPRKIRFDLHVGGTRFRPSLPWTPTEANLARARLRIQQIKARIAAGTFSFAEDFPDYRGERGQRPACALTCAEVFEAFLTHSQARVAREDLSPSTLASYRQILSYTWGPTLGPLPFLSVRHSTLARIADAQTCGKKTYNNLLSAIRRAFEFGYRDHPEQRDPASLLKSVRLRRKDRAPIDPFTIDEAETLIAGIHADWGQAQGNFDEFRFFTGLRPCEQIALVLADFERTRGFLTVSKTRVRRINRDVTKTGSDRQVELCARAVSVLERQLRLRESLEREGRLEHEYLFFEARGQVFPDTRNPYRRWGRTLARLPIRYRNPYSARHTSVSWNLMIGRNPLRVAQQHGHSPTTMWSVYAAWTCDTPDADVERIRHAMTSPSPHEG